MKTNSTMTIGLDLGDRFSQFCILGGDGEVLKHGRVATQRTKVQRFFEKFSCRVVMEVGTHSSWVSDICKAQGLDTIVANPRRVRLISHGHRKSDRHDAELLARLGRADTSLLAPIEHRRAKAREDLVLIRTRAELVEVRTSLILHVRGIVKAQGERIPSGDAKCFHQRARAALEGRLAKSLEPTLVVIDQMTQQISNLDVDIKELALDYPEVELMMQIPGVGIITSITFALTLDDKYRFKRSRDVGAYLGLCPRRSQSGDHDPELRISKTGDKYLRRLLVQCAHHVFHRKAPDSDLRRWALKLAARGSKNAKKRAIVAVARKLAVVMHRLWVTAEHYQRFGYAA